ncbi:hypothetical protein KGF54_002486 [Candida jiufengensis]|uniref:uncharacterized protein n=1 Tax=Candida jiufengensis TaxID=497108 RepID=UPI002225A3CE|nr:uncharacterized protein KGF54_002486 [Candida jiufengensis]KAI5953115.1 hypothetical protein KGF54_002486 [Candida jiufengensis]
MFKSSIAPTTLIFKRNMITANAVLYTQHGEPKDVLFTQKYQIDNENLQPNKIIVKTIASPINPSDINQIQGVYPSKPAKTLDFQTNEPAAPCGNEGLFEILKIGKDIKNFEIGDWVIPSQVNFGTWRTHALGEESDFIKISKKLTINQGATISVNPLTAYLMLTHYIKLTPEKDWFIQNGGTSAVGKYAIQIGKLLGINSISVIRDRPNLQETKDVLLRLGGTQIITEEENSSREFSSTIKQWVKETNGELKLALNCVGGKSSSGIARKLNNNGLMLTYGGMSMQPVTIPTSLYIFKNFTSAGFWVTELLKKNQELKQKTLNQIIEWYEKGELKDAPSNLVVVDDELSKVYVKGIEDKSGKQVVTY